MNFWTNVLKIFTRFVVHTIVAFIIVALFYTIIWLGCMFVSWTSYGYFDILIGHTVLKGLLRLFMVMMLGMGYKVQLQSEKWQEILDAFNI